MGTSRNDLPLSLAARGPSWPVWGWMIAALLGSGVGLAGCATGGSGPDAGTSGPRDARVADGETPRDGGRDAGDGGNGLCSGVSCPAFEHCISGSCRPYPACAGDGTCPAGSVCHARRCVPGDVDVDGDGSPASEDCDETDATRSPDLPEVCDMLDNDCDSTVDDGDPAQLCESDPAGGICLEGACGCPEGTFDVDRAVSGCECTAAPAITTGTSCAAPIDLGNVSDAAPGQRMMITGNVVPADRAIWYRFRAVDSPDTSCDAYHARAWLMANPDDAFELTVFEGSCAAAGCGDSGYVDFEDYTDFAMDIAGVRTGECPCAVPTAASTTVTHCTDSSSDYFVRVRRRAGSTLSCASYTLEISNGVY